MSEPISWEVAGLDLALALAGGYLLGSAPFGMVLTSLASLGELRDSGSVNIGTTNALRTGPWDRQATSSAIRGKAVETEQN